MLLILMLQDNDIVIMDEPFNGIDLAGTIVLRQWLKEMKAKGKCVILSSHIVSAMALPLALARTSRLFDG